MFVLVRWDRVYYAFSMFLTLCMWELKQFVWIDQGYKKPRQKPAPWPKKLSKMKKERGKKGQEKKIWKLQTSKGI